MEIKVTGQHIDIGQALQDHVENALKDGIAKYFDRAIIAEVVFSKESHLFVTTIIVDEGVRGSVFIRSQAKENDVYASFEKACERIEKQLRRYKRKIKNHHKQKRSEVDAELMNGDLLAGTKYTISKGDEDIEVSDDNPLIVAEKAVEIERLSVSDAVMRMDLAQMSALMFINEQTGNVSVVYHREDGNISWVESPLNAEQLSKKQKAA